MIDNNKKKSYTLEVLHSAKFQKTVLMTIDGKNVIVDALSDNGGLHLHFHEEGCRGPMLPLYNVGDKG